MAADNALGFLAELAAIKAGSASTAADIPDTPEPKKKKKKKKKGDKKSKKGGKKAAAITDEPEPKKKGKKGKSGKGKKGKSKAAPVAITDEPEEDEKTPEPPSNLSEIEKRKFRLKYARKKLEKRKKQREQVRAQKAGKDGKDATNGDSVKASYGKTYIDKFMQQLQKEQSYVQSKIAEAMKEEEEEEKASKDAAANDMLSGLGLSSDAASKRKKKNKSLDRKPGRVNHLTFGEDIDYGLIIEKKIKTHSQSVQTDPKYFEDYLREEFLDDFMDRDGNPLSIEMKVIAGMVESVDKFGYPRELWEIQSASSPSPTAEKIRSRQRAEDERKAKQQALKEKRKREREEERARRKNIPYMPRKDATKLIKQGDFLENFRKKAKWIERTLGINMEYMDNMADDDFFGYDDEDEYYEEEEMKGTGMDDNDDGEEYKDDHKENIKQTKATMSRRESVKEMKNRPKKKKIKNYLKLKKKFGINMLNGRPIGNINFSASNRDWFASTYYVAGSRYSTDKNGCIAIWNFMLPTYPEYTLTAQNMITSTHFHPTDPFFIFGSTINGQILMWDLRNNKQKPIQRSNFSNGHSAPVFTMSFLPNIKQKQAEIAKKKGLSKQKQNKKQDSSSHDVQHILSVSNDGKLCIWRTDQLSVKPLNQSILKPSDDQSTARQIELITTCFDYSYRDHGNVILGSDEGYLYKAEIFNQNNNNDQSLSIKESINGHYGPITNLNFFPIKHYSKTYNFKDNATGLYLTSSYDWTVKLWHNKIGTKLGKHNNGPISVFDQMTDYVYDVKWNIGGKPGVFACCDGEGKINLFDLTKDFKHPICEPIKITERKNIAATTIEWTLDGKYLACGDSDGNVLFYNVHRAISQQSLESCEAFQSICNKHVVPI